MCSFTFIIISSGVLLAGAFRPRLSMPLSSPLPLLFWNAFSIGMFHVHKVLQTNDWQTWCLVSFFVKKYDFALFLCLLSSPFRGLRYLNVWKSFYPSYSKIQNVWRNTPIIFRKMCRTFITAFFTVRWPEDLESLYFSCYAFIGLTLTYFLFFLSIFLFQVECLAFFHLVFFELVSATGSAPTFLSSLIVELPLSFSGLKNRPSPPSSMFESYSINRRLMDLVT